jgi:hypothetical protein
VKSSNAASMAVFSVLESTTRKFFEEDGGGVTCCIQDMYVSDWDLCLGASFGPRRCTYAYAGEKEASY